MRTKFLIGAFAGALSLNGFGPAAAAAQPSGVPGPGRAYDTAKIDAELRRQCADGTFSGEVVVRAHGREIYAGGCGEADILNHIANTRQTRFKIYSTSKLMTGLTVMRLVEQKRIALDAPITDYVKDAPAAWRTVTVRTLLNHTSGVKDLTANMVVAYTKDYDTAFADTLKGLSPADAALDNPPGTHFAYNNFGFELLALAVERITGEPFPQTVQRLVFDPAGMKTASFQPSTVLLGHPMDTPEDGLALGYNGAPDKLQQATNWAFIQMGSGAVRATVDDFIALDQALKDGRVVSRATLAEMMRDPVVSSDPRTPGRLYGLGIFMQMADGVMMQGHTGGTNGYISDFERYPADDAMMIALTNRGFVATKWLRADVAEMLKAGRAGGR